MRKRVRSVAVLGAISLASAGVLVASTSTTATAAGFGYDHLNTIQKRLISGTAAFELDTSATGQAARSARAATSAAERGSSHHVSGGAACDKRLGGNVKVNQNCLNLTDPDLQGRGQAQNETSISVDPRNGAHIVASYNDYRRGDGTCGTSYSLDSGRTWSDATIPNGFTRGDAFGAARQYWEAGGDTSVAWDTRGNAYLSCQLFNRGTPTTPNPDQSSAFYVYRSTGTDGASWNFPGRPVAEFNDVAGTGAALLDKQLLTVDDTVGSPYQDRVYVTWTLFAADGTAYIYEAHSDDYGESFSGPVLVSGDSPLCTQTFGVPTPHGACNENQFSQPFTGPDGSLYVAWANFNNDTSAGLGDDDGDGNGGDGLRASASAPSNPPQDNHNQMLLARSTNGGASFSAPVKVGDYFDLPDCATYQNGADAGRACVPEKADTSNSIFRATNYPVGAVNPHTGAVVVTYGSYINKHSNENNGCVPTGFSDFGLNTYDGVKVPGACNNDILVSRSTDHGATFNGGTTDARQMPTVNDARGQRTTDQFWQWADFTRSGQLVVAYYDRQYGSDEVTGYSDYSVTANSASSQTVFRATSSSNPPPTQFTGLFMGDYAALAVTGQTAYPFWADTRSPELFLCTGTGTPGNPPQACTGPGFSGARANDQEVFVQRLSISGQGR
jgi:hypothetical protein